MRINRQKYSQTTPGKTVATPAYNRANSHAIRHTHHSPHQSPHLDQTRPKTRRLTLTQALKITLISYRQNLTQETLAHLFDISQPTISRTIKTIEKALEKALTPLVPSLEVSLKPPGSLVIDRTLVPTWNWRSQGKRNFSGQHKRAGFNHQVICTLDGRLLAITDPLPRARDDAYAFRAHGLDQFLDSSTLADKGYVGLGLATPTKRKPGVKLTKEQKRNNRMLNRITGGGGAGHRAGVAPGGFCAQASGARWTRMGGCFQ